MLNGQVHLGCSPSPDGSQQVLHFALQKTKFAEEHPQESGRAATDVPEM